MDLSAYLAHQGKGVDVILVATSNPDPSRKDNGQYATM